MGRRDADLVLLRPAGRDVQEHVVGVAERGDRQPVRVQVRRLLERVDEAQPDHVAGPHAQRGRDIAPVVHLRDDPPSGDLHGSTPGAERQLERAVAAGHDGRVAERLRPGGARSARVARGERQRHEQRRAQVHGARAGLPVAPKTVNGALATLPNSGADATSV